ncbi:MAG: hypothetical protein RIC35_23915 [Marinoscillum sp.]
MRHLLFVVMVASMTFVSAQDGKHVFVQFNLENNAWALDNYQKVTVSVAYPEVMYLSTYGSGKGGGNWELGFPGIFSAIMGNGNTLSSDDSLYITNINMCNFISRHYLIGVAEDAHSIGFAWGLNFVGNQLAQNAEEGNLDTGDEVAQLKGIGVLFGATYEFNMEDKLLIDADLTSHLVYNSESAKANSRTFHGIGWRSRVRARYYLSYSIVAKAEILLESNSHGPNEINVSEDGGKFGYSQLSFGIGYQW